MFGNGETLRLLCYKTKACIRKTSLLHAVFRLWPKNTQGMQKHYRFLSRRAAVDAGDLIPAVSQLPAWVGRGIRTDSNSGQTNRKMGMVILGPLGFLFHKFYRQY